jgi:hypothetical protein
MTRLDDRDGGGPASRSVSDLPYYLAGAGMAAALIAAAPVFWAPPFWVLAMLGGGGRAPSGRNGGA